jgi:putative ABC transport system ATP-binding protein
MRPRILLADEPTGNLDTNSGRQVLELIEELNRGGLTLIVVTHDPAVAHRAQRVIILQDGRIVARVPGGEIREAWAGFAGASGRGR